MKKQITAPFISYQAHNIIKGVLLDKVVAEQPGLITELNTKQHLVLEISALIQEIKKLR